MKLLSYKKNLKLLKYGIQKQKIKLIKMKTNLQINNNYLLNYYYPLIIFMIKLYKMILKFDLIIKMTQKIEIKKILKKKNKNKVIKMLLNIMLMNT